jgi:hypothetical protein
MSIISKEEKKDLYKKVKTGLGWPGRPMKELNESVLDTLYETVVEDYSSYVSNWLIEQKWGELQGLEIDQANFVQALTFKTLDFEKNYAIAFGKQTGMGSMSPWELKKDFVEIQSNQQIYQIPAGREINEVLWETPSQVMGGGFGMGDPIADQWTMAATGWLYGGMAAGAVLPSYSMLLGAQDRFQKKKILQSELTYKITAGPNGTKFLHLYPVPGSPSEMTGAHGKHFSGVKVWYWYYDTNSLGRDKCLEENEDIIHLPDEVPLQTWKWSKMNTISKTRIRRLLLAKASTYVGTVRGAFSGDLSSPNGSSLKMDYGMFLEKGEKEESKLYEELTQSLEKISNTKILEDKASQAENLNKILGYQPPMTQFYNL